MVVIVVCVVLILLLISGIIWLDWSEEKAFQKSRGISNRPYIALFGERKFQKSREISNRPYTAWLDQEEKRLGLPSTAPGRKK